MSTMQVPKPGGESADVWKFFMESLSDAMYVVDDEDHNRLMVAWGV